VLQKKEKSEEASKFSNVFKIS